MSEEHPTDFQPSSSQGKHSDTDTKPCGNSLKRTALSVIVPQKETPVSLFAQTDFPKYTTTAPVSDLVTEMRLIAAGAVGSIYVCKLRDIDIEAALKVVKVTSLETLHMSINEFETLFTLHHPNIITVYRLYLSADTGKAWLITELIRGQSMSEFICSAYSFCEAEIKSIAFQLLRALQVVHERGLIHRDVSPGNVLLAGGVVKLIDFQTVTQSTGRPVRGVVGTPCYQAPEMWAESGYDSKVDIWSAGTVLCRAVKASGRAFSENCYTFLAQCTQIDASKRPSASEALTHPWFS